MLLGSELIKAFQLVINVSFSSPLSFTKSTKSPGVRRVESQIVKERTMQIVEASVDTGASAIATVPFTFDTALLVANTVSQVVEQRVKVLLCNIDVAAVEIKPGQQLACYRPLA